MKLYEICFDYKLDAEDCKCEGDWETELDNFRVNYNEKEDFMKQLSEHKLFLLLCSLDLSNDDYMKYCQQLKTIPSQRTMITIEQLLSYFVRCTEHVDVADRRRIFKELSSYLQYWANMSKDRIEEEFIKAGIEK